MDDLISRQAAIDALCKAGCGSGYCGISCEEHMALENLPSIQPEQRWIPCSERLPELDESVLATTAWDDITIAWRIGISKWFIHEGNTNAETDDVLAWMPLPELYKGEQE